MDSRYERTLGRILPGDRLLAVLFCLGLNGLVYWGAQALTAHRTLTNLTTALDQMVPFEPGWSIVYVAAYLFWAISFVVLARGWNWYGFMTAEVLAKLLCGLCFLILPTTNLRPELTGDGFGVWLLGLIYRVDAPRNLLPSIHCMESWLCFAGLRRRTDVSLLGKAAALACTVLICWSTLAVRQHVITDVISGVLLAEGMMMLGRRFHWGLRLKVCFNALWKRISESNHAKNTP